MTTNLDGRFILTVLKKIREPIEESIDIFDGVYIARSVEVFYETDYNARDKETPFEAMGAMAILFDKKGKEIAKEGIMYKYLGKSEDQAFWDIIIAPPEYRQEDMIMTSDDGRELMTNIAEVIGDYTNDVLLRLGRLITAYPDAYKVKLIVGSIAPPEFNLSEESKDRMISNGHLAVVVRQIINEESNK